MANVSYGYDVSFSSSENPNVMSGLSARAKWKLGGDESSVEEESPPEMITSTSLQSMLSAIIEERSKDAGSHKILSDGNLLEFVFSVRL
jgi:hypothetical protein